jgi:hypothetical protein
VTKPPRKKAAAVTALASAPREDALLARVVDIIEAARGRVARSVNTAMVQAYWLIGREIVEVEQHGEKRAGYGERVVEGLAKLWHRGSGGPMASIPDICCFLLSRASSAESGSRPRHVPNCWRIVGWISRSSS